MRARGVEMCRGGNVSKFPFFNDACMPLNIIVNMEADRDATTQVYTGRCVALLAMKYSEWFRIPAARCQNCRPRFTKNSGAFCSRASPAVSPLPGLQMLDVNMAIDLCNRLHFG